MAGKRDIAEIRNLLEELTDRLADLSDDTQAALLEESDQLADRLRERASAMMGAARTKGRELAKRAKDAGHRADEYAHEEPWKVAAGAALVGAIFGFLAASRRQ